MQRHFQSTKHFPWYNKKHTTNASFSEKTFVISKIAFLEFLTAIPSSLTEELLKNSKNVYVALLASKN